FSNEEDIQWFIYNRLTAAGTVISSPAESMTRLTLHESNGVSGAMRHLRRRVATAGYCDSAPERECTVSAAGSARVCARAALRSLWSGSDNAASSAMISVSSVTSLIAAQVAGNHGAALCHA